jgi:hypothetical protein
MLEKAKGEQREIYVVNTDYGYEIRKKLRDQWMSEHQNIAANLNMIQSEKFKIELDSLKDSCRQMFI